MGFVTEKDEVFRPVFSHRIRVITKGTMMIAFYYARVGGVFRHRTIFMRG